jgi:hypothetical protein
MQNTVERTQGCWNCKSFSLEGGQKLWKIKRQNDLATAARLAVEDAEGEDSVRVTNIRKMVNTIDHGIALNMIGTCMIGASEADLVVNSYLCDKWNGAQGASVARAGARPDKLPGELMEDMQNGILPKKRIS